MAPPGFASLETPRLILRRFRDGDRAAFVAYRSDPEVARYQSWTRCGEDEAAAFIHDQQSVEPGTPGEWFQFAIERRADGVLVGDCALRACDEGRQGEIGFTLAREHQGQGYASEAMTRMLDHAFAALTLHRVYAVTDCLNAPAVALLERLGLRREGSFVRNVWFKGRWGDEHLYAVLAEEWRERRGAARA